MIRFDGLPVGRFVVSTAIQASSLVLCVQEQQPTQRQQDV
jgi:hypothetical protein